MGWKTGFHNLFFAADMEAHRNVIGKRRSLGYKECGVTAIMIGKLKCLQLHRLLLHNVPTEQRPRFTEKTAAPSVECYFILLCLMLTNAYCPHQFM